MCDMTALNNVDIDPKARGSINYAKARSAIDMTFRNRKDRRSARMTVIKFLGGKLIHSKTNSDGRCHKTVVFPDQTKATF